jgi:hypothetical protein
MNYNNDSKTVVVNMIEFKHYTSSKNHKIMADLHILVKKGLISGIIDNNPILTFEFTQEFWDFLSPQIKLRTQKFLEQTENKTNL